MKATFFTFVLILAFAGTAQAKIQISNIQSIVCKTGVEYDEESPSNKTQSDIGVKIFVPGSRTDVRAAKGAFILTECGSVTAESTMECLGNQQFYLEEVANDKIHFGFLLEYKASGDLEVKGETATGQINQKGHVTELNCSVNLKQY